MDLISLEMLNDLNCHLETLKKYKQNVKKKQSWSYVKDVCVLFSMLAR